MVGKAAESVAGMLDGLLWVVVVACLVWMVVWLPGHVLLVRSRLCTWARPRVFARVAGVRPHPWVLGLIGLVALPAVAQRRPPDAPSRQARAAAPPWSATSGFPPPRPLVRIRAYDARPAIPKERVADAARSAERTDVIPSIEEKPAAFPFDRRDRLHRLAKPHGGRPDDDRSSAPDSPRLFERPRRHGGDADRGRSDDGRHGVAEEERERSLARGRHPAGKARLENCATGLGHHVVSKGDTLWHIAGDVLGTDDVARIARYWPAIHRANRRVIGADPGLIFPGTLLRLPVRCSERRA
jgi:nucleoid-associated protein YgaU